jgi:hypothetical protein
MQVVLIRWDVVQRRRQQTSSNPTVMDLLHGRGVRKVRQLRQSVMPVTTMLLEMVVVMQHAGPVHRHRRWPRHGVELRVVRLMLRLVMRVQFKCIGVMLLPKVELVGVQRVHCKGYVRLRGRNSGCWRLKPLHA